MALVNERNENICHEELDLLREIAAHKPKEVPEDIDHKHIAIRQVADKDDALDSREGLKEMEVFVVVGRVRAFETS